MENITDILDQLVTDITNPERSLSDIFLKVKVLAFKLNSQELKQWVEKEVNGYDSDDEYPKYRSLPTAIYGNLIQDLPGRTIYRRNEKLVIDYVSQETYESLTRLNLSSSISEIEEFIKSGNAHVSVPHYIQAEISKTFSNYWHVESAWRVISGSYLVGVLNSIKSRLLDFIMELNQTLGTRNLSLSDRQREVNELFRNTIGNISATTINLNIGNSNNNLNTGDNQNSTITQKNTQNYTSNEIEKIKELVVAIKAGIDKHFDGDYKYVMEAEIRKIESQIEKPTPIKLIVNSALQVMYELMIEAAGSAYSPIILEQLRNVLG